jgi:thiol-disulfide isomerase/thioredoxin
VKATLLVVTASVALAVAVFACAGIAGGGDRRIDPADGPNPLVDSFAARLPAGSNFPSLKGATDWINSEPLTTASLRGKVVLVEFWTYTCINWRRESPYVRAWAERYKDKGFVVIGVHSPEFWFEKNADNVRRATQEIGITYPVAVDSRLGVWTAFDNEYWPALYFIDAKGRIRGRHFGEGDYARSEQLIRQLLMEAGASNLGNDLTVVTPTGTEISADPLNLGSPESYLGFARETSFGSPGGIKASVVHSYTEPQQLRLNHWALSGDWLVLEDSVVSSKAPVRVAYRFHARDVNLVMGPAMANATPRFRVLIDGKPPGDEHGVDVDQQGLGTVTEQRVYQLVRQQGEITDRLFEIEFLEPGAEAFDFTFG